MNTCNLIGRLTTDPEIKTVSGEQTVCNFTLAVNRRYKDKNGNRQADFLRCVAWNKTAEMISRYLAKGDQCGVFGSIQSRSYTAQDGSTRVLESSADIVHDAHAASQRVAVFDMGRRRFGQYRSRPRHWAKSAQCHVAGGGWRLRELQR